MFFRPLYIFPIILLLGLSGAVQVVRAHRAAPLAGEAQPASDWRMDVLAGVGNAEPSADTLAFLAAWHQAEGGTAAFNWLNTTQPTDGAIDYNSVHVKNYPDYQTGIRATVETLTNGRYPRTLAGLRTNQPV